MTIIKIVFMVFVLLWEGFASASDMIVRENFMICPDDQFKTTKKALQHGYRPLSPVLEELKFVLNDSIKYVALKSLSIDDNIFPKIYSEFLFKTRENIEIIDLSHNFFTEKSLDFIKQIIYFPKLKFLNLTGTPVSLKNVKKIVVPLKKDGVSLDNIRKIIFMEKYYIWHAKNRVYLYNDLARTKHIPQDWDDCQRSFYKEIEKYENTKKVEPYVFSSPEESLISFFKRLEIYE